MFVTRVHQDGVGAALGRGLQVVQPVETNPAGGRGMEALRVLWPEHFASWIPHQPCCFDQSVLQMAAAGQSGHSKA